MYGSHVRPDGTLEFWFNYHGTEQAYVAGTFSDWEPQALEARGEGWWSGSFGPFEDGNVFYKFVANGEWLHDQVNFRRSLDMETSFLHVGSGCGHLVRRSFFSHALGRDKSVLVYLPPSYCRSEWASYPCLTLLGGLLDDETTWSRKAALEDVADRLMGEKEVPEMVILMPDKDDTWHDEEGWGAFGTYLSEDLRLWAQAEFRILDQAEGRAIEGLSMGGAWAMRLAAWKPTLFGSVGGLSCAFTEELGGSLRWAAPQLADRAVRFRLACGDDEGQALVDATMACGDFLQRLGLQCETCMDAGPHDWPLWRAQLPHTLAFHGYGFRERLNA